MKTLNKSLFLVVLLVFPVVSFGQIIDNRWPIESGGRTKFEASGEGVVIPDGSPTEVPIRYTGDVKKPQSDNTIRFNLKVGEKTLVSKHLGGITITLNSLARDIANINLVVRGGCGPVADDSCLGRPSSEETFDLKLGELKIIPGTGSSLTFAQKISDNEAMFILTTPISRPTPTPTHTPIPPTRPSPTPTLTPRPLKAPKINEVTEIREVESGSYEIKAKQKGRILFLVPVEVNVSYSLKDSAVTKVKRPWWSFLVWVR